MVPSGRVNQAQIASGVKRAEATLAPDVVRIRYSFANDWTGDPSIFFRIVLSDDASRKTQLGETAQRVTLTILNELDSEQLDLHCYFNFRTLSEQAELKEPALA